MIVNGDHRHNAQYDNEMASKISYNIIYNAIRVLILVPSYYNSFRFAIQIPFYMQVFLSYIHILFASTSSCVSHQLARRGRESIILALASSRSPLSTSLLA